MRREGAAIAKAAAKGRGCRVCGGREGRGDGIVEREREEKRGKGASLPPSIPPSFSSSSSLQEKRGWERSSGEGFFFP